MNVFPLTHNHHLGFPLCDTPPTSTSHIMLIVASLPLRHQHIDANHLTAPSPHQRATTTTNTMTTVPCQQRPAQRPKPRRRAAANAPMTPQHVRLMSFGAVFAASVMVVRVIWRMRGWFYYCRWYKKCVGIKMQHPLTNKRREVRYVTFQPLRSVRDPQTLVPLERLRLSAFFMYITRFGFQTGECVTFH